MRNITTLLQIALCHSKQAAYFYLKHKRMRWTLTWTIFYVALTSVLAQEASAPEKSFHLKLGTGLALQTVKDDAMSPLTYDGTQIAFQTGGEWRVPKGLHRVDALFWLGEASAESGRTTENYTFAINGGYLHRISKPEATWNMHLGGMITTWGSFRDHQSLINSDFFYDLFFSIGPSASLERNFQLFKREWILDWQLTLPALTYGVRPSYSGLDSVPPDKDGFQGWEDAQIGSFDMLQNVKSRIELAYPLKNGNRLGLMYYWDFFNANLEPHAVIQAMQSIQFNLHFKF